ncbi:glycosyltransferase, partial [Rhodoferax sp. 4810]|nr:glycosyltransferase [Rhodoferax jenense]
DGQIGVLHQAMVERDGQIGVLNQAMVERDGQIGVLHQAMVERDGQICILNQALAASDGRIANLNQALVARDEKLNALSTLVAERDRIIQETYRSHSWQLTKPIRFLSRMLRKVLNFSLKLKPSKIKYIYNLAKPHIKTVIQNPGRLKSKLHFFNIAWQSGGYRGVIRQLQQSRQSQQSQQSTIGKHSKGISTTEVMQQLSCIPHELKPIDPFYGVAETASGYRCNPRPVVLFISHTYGGGTEKHIVELADALITNNARVLLLRPFNGENGCDVTLEAIKAETFKIELSSQNIDLLAGVIKAFAVSKVHVHHTIGFEFSIEELLIAIGLPYDITIHDYYTICPLINLRTANKGYCGSPTTDDCNACLELEPTRAGGIEITWWRAKYASLLNGANAVYCPSLDTANRISEHYPTASLQVVPHEDIILPSARHIKGARTKRRIALLGVLASHKGLSLIEDALAIIEKCELPIEIALIGYPERAISYDKHFTQTGPYIDSELPALIELIDPDAILFPAQWPETYSYTLTTAILSGRPIVVANLGSLPERIKDIGNAFAYPYQYTATELVDYLLMIHLSSD